VGEQFTLWHTDLEQELAAWPTFKAALEEVGGEIGRKYASHYRAAAVQASDEDMPENLRLLVVRLLGLGDQRPAALHVTVPTASSQDASSKSPTSDQVAPVA
jgi:hypothetical protein